MAVTPFDPPQQKATWTMTPHANFTALSSIEPELLSIEVLHCGNREFSLFCFCDLDLDPMTFLTRIHWRRAADQKWTFHFKAFGRYRITNRQTDIQTNAIKKHYHFASPVVLINFCVPLNQPDRSPVIITYANMSYCEPKKSSKFGGFRYVWPWLWPFSGGSRIVLRGFVFLPKNLMTFFSRTLKCTYPKSCQSATRTHQQSGGKLFSPSARLAIHGCGTVVASCGHVEHLQ